MIIHGDNLEALKALLPQYEGRVKCIYIDPPYNTGNEKWCYNDNVNDPHIQKWLGEVVGKEGEDLTRHDKWLCMMYPRLMLLQKLLADDGAIFISIDDNELYNLKSICDEIFGASCFVSNISWQRTYSTRNDSKGIVNEVEHILVYSKQPGWNPNKLSRTEEMNARYSNPDNDVCAWKSTDAFAPGATTHQGMVNEYNPFAAKAYSENYPDIPMKNCDIKSLKESDIRKWIGSEPVDLIIGGPPCQSFSTVGQRNYDEKAQLYTEYLRVLKIARPKMFLFENVRGILSMREIFYKRDAAGNILYELKDVEGRESLTPRKKPVIDHYGKSVMEILNDQFSNLGNGLGYNIWTERLNAMDYGVPENRERVFIVGIRNDLNLKWNCPPKEKSAHLTIKDAISDLPEVLEGQSISSYQQLPQNKYQELMRHGSNELTQHFCGCYSEKIRAVIQHVKQGEGKNEFNALVDSGKIDKSYRLTSGYANTYGRLIADQPSPTITNNLTTVSSLRCIHYSQNRALTPREGARIQSFPDWYKFEGFKSDVCTQIGNAVPPLLALRLASQFEKTLK